MMRGVELDFAVVSDVGKKRSVNEDSAFACTPAFLVFDGMGGHEAGDLASQSAASAFASCIGAGRPSSVPEVSVALDAARVAVAEVAAGRERGAGCTLSGAVLVVSEGELAWLVINVGDSRVYVHRGAQLQQLTVDHSLRSELGEEHDGCLPPRNIITRALGSADSTADSWLLPVETGARLLVCSDGLTTELGDEDLRATLTMGGKAEAVCEELVRRANEAGGRDNVTVIVVDVVGGGRQWHVPGVQTTVGGTDGDDTLTATVPRRRVRWGFER